MIECGSDTKSITNEVKQVCSKESFLASTKEEKTASGMTSLAAVPVYLDLSRVMGLEKSIVTHRHVKTQGWTEKAMDMLPGGVTTVRLRLPIENAIDTTFKGCRRVPAPKIIQPIVFPLGC
jgi:hypothetical protein